MKNLEIKPVKQVQMILTGLAALLITVPHLAVAQSIDDEQVVEPPTASAPAAKPKHKHHTHHKVAPVTAQAAAPVDMPAKTAARVSVAVDAPAKTAARVAAPVEAPMKTAARVSMPVEAPMKTAARVSMPVDAPMKTAARVSAPVIDAPEKTAARVSAPVVEAPAKTAARVSTPVAFDPQPMVADKFGSRVSAPVDAPDKTAARVSAPVDAPDKTAARVSAPVDAPTKTAARVSTPVAFDPQPMVADKFGSRVSAPVAQPAPASLDPAAPAKLGARVAAPVPVVSQDPNMEAPPAEAAPNLMQAPPSKLAARVSADPAPDAPTKLGSRVSAQVGSAIPDQTLRQEIALPNAGGAASNCQAPIEPQSGLQQAASLRDTLNRRLAQNGPVRTPVVVAHDDDVDDGEEMVKTLGKGEKRQHGVRTEIEKSTTISPFVKKLLMYSTKESQRACRTLKSGKLCIAGNHSKRACLQGVRMAFQEAAGQSTGSGWTMNAKDAGPFVAKYGYHKVSPKDLKPENAPLGSVMIYDNPANSRHAGHIEIKNVNGYTSDFFESHPISESKNVKRRLIAIWVPPTSSN